MAVAQQNLAELLRGFDNMRYELEGLRRDGQANGRQFNQTVAMLMAAVTAAMAKMDPARQASSSALESWAPGLAALERMVADVGADVKGLVAEAPLARSSGPIPDPSALQLKRDTEEYFSWSSLMLKAELCISTMASFRNPLVCMVLLAYGWQVASTLSSRLTCYAIALLMDPFTAGLFFGYKVVRGLHKTIRRAARSICACCCCRAPPPPPPPPSSPSIFGMLGEAVSAVLSRGDGEAQDQGAAAQQPAQQPPVRPGGQQSPPPLSLYRWLKRIIIGGGGDQHDIQLLPRYVQSRS